MFPAVYEATLLLVLFLILIKANAIEQFWTWEPLQSLDLSTMTPAWDSHEAGNARIFICRAKIGNEVLVGSYQDPPPRRSFDPKTKCCMVDSRNQRPVYEEDKSKIEIMRYSHDKVKWVKVNADNEETDDSKGIRPHLISVGNEGEEKFVCRFIKSMNDAYLGRVQPAGGFSACVSGEHDRFTTVTALQYEIQAAN